MTKTSLFRGAALGALLALGFGAVAEAKPVKHHHRGHDAVVSSDKAEIEELRDEVKALEDRLSAQEGLTQQTQAQAQQATVAAQAAASQAQSAEAAADAEIKTIPGEVKVQVAAMPKPKLGWWGDTTVSGRMYYDLTNIDQKSDGVKLPGSPNGVNFDVKRFYLSVDHKFNDVFSADFTTDFTYDSGPAGATQLYIKKAYIQAKLSDALIFRAGSADLPWVPFVEDVYGYRYVENVLIDKEKFGTSADWGVHALGKIPMGPVTFNYALAAVNGNGYKKPGFIAGVNRSNDMDFEGRVSANVGDFVAAVGGYEGKLGKAVQGTPTFNTAQRFDALLAYQGKRFRIGGEYMYAKDWNDVTQANPLLVNTSEGWSGWGSFKVTDKLGVFGRYDRIKPKRDTATTLTGDYFNVGISYEPVKIVDFALVYKQDKVNNGTITDSNGTIGGIANGTYDEVGLWGQFRW